MKLQIAEAPKKWSLLGLGPSAPWIVALGRVQRKQKRVSGRTLWVRSLLLQVSKIPSSTPIKRQSKPQSIKGNSWPNCGSRSGVILLPSIPHGQVRELVFEPPWTNAGQSGNPPNVQCCKSKILNRKICPKVHTSRSEASSPCKISGSDILAKEAPFCFAMAFALVPSGTFKTIKWFSGS